MRGAFSPEFILMDDNVCPHRVHVTNEYLERETIVGIDLSTQSPDLNPIDQAWDILQRAISATSVQPRT